MFKSEKTKLILTLVLACVLLAVIVALRPENSQGVPMTQFWNNKFRVASQFDIVAAGDSRVLHGLDMQQLEEAGLGQGFNFGFRGSPSSPEYISAASDCLSDDGKRILVLGITPNGFTKNAVSTSGFSQKRDDFKSSWEAPVLWRQIEQKFRPITLADAKRLVTRKRNPLQETWHANGWIETSHKKPNQKLALRFYKVRFNGNMAKSDLVDKACESIAQSVRDGVRVFGFKPPVSTEMTELESEKSGFDYETFVKQFESAGGVWIDVDPSQFQTYDGSHLHSESATAFSKWIANEIRTYLEGAQ